MLLVLPEGKPETVDALGPWLAANVNKNRNMVRFLLPKADAPYLYDDRDLLIMARCTMLAKDWMDAEPQYKDLHRRFNNDLRRDWLAGRFDRYALLSVWDYQNPTACQFTSRGMVQPAPISPSPWKNTSLTPSSRPRTSARLPRKPPSGATA